jgi:hypothetical protein
MINTNDNLTINKLKIQTLPTGTPVNNVGIDASGNIIVGTTGGGGGGTFIKGTTTINFNNEC